MQNSVVLASYFKYDNLLIIFLSHLRAPRNAIRDHTLQLVCVCVLVLKFFFFKLTKKRSFCTLNTWFKKKKKTHDI